MVPLYLDDCLIAGQVARQLRAAGHLVYVTSDLGVEGQDDTLHLETATRLGAVLATQNQGDFVRLHRRWGADRRQHAGILVTRWLPIGLRIQRLERAAPPLDRRGCRQPAHAARPIRHGGAWSSVRHEPQPSRDLGGITRPVISFVDLGPRSLTGHARPSGGCDGLETKIA